MSPRRLFCFSTRLPVFEMQVLFAAVLYAGFVGSVTAVITSYTSTASNYRDSLSKLRSFATSHGLSKSTTREIIAYFDAYWVELKGFDRERMLQQPGIGVRIVRV